MIDKVAIAPIMRPMKPKKLSDELKSIIQNCGQSRYAISKATGIPQPTLCRFVNGQRPLTLRNIDTLAEYLDLEIVVRKPRKAGK